MKRNIISCCVLVVLAFSSLTDRCLAVSSGRNTEWFIFVASDLPVSSKRMLEAPIVGLIGTTAVTEDVLHVVRTPSHEPVVSIAVPSGGARTRLRNHDLRTSFKALGIFLRSTPTKVGNAIEPYQIALPAIPSTIQSLRRTKSPVRIILYGNPVYDDVQQAGWSMKRGLVPSDASIHAEICPFAATEKYPPLTDIRWLAHSSNWGVNETHRRAIRRFYQLFLQENGARLTRMTVDPVAAFLVDDSLEELPLASFSAHPDNYVGMRSVIHLSKQLDPTRRDSIIPVANPAILVPRKDTKTQSVPTQQKPKPQSTKPGERTTEETVESSATLRSPHPNKEFSSQPHAVQLQGPVDSISYNQQPNVITVVEPQEREIALIRPANRQGISTEAEVERLLRDTKQNLNRMFIAINWIGTSLLKSGDIDIDIWLRSAGYPSELNFKNKKTQFGRLYRDTRTQGSIDGSVDEFLSWECAEISHNRLHDLTLWLDAFQTNQPARVRVIAVWNGRRREKLVTIHTNAGDSSKEEQTRRSSTCWHKVDLVSMFFDSPDNCSVPIERHGH